MLETEDRDEDIFFDTNGTDNDLEFAEANAKNKFGQNSINQYKGILKKFNLWLSANNYHECLTNSLCVNIEESIKVPINLEVFKKYVGYATRSKDGLSKVLSKSTFNKIKQSLYYLYWYKKKRVDQRTAEFLKESGKNFNRTRASAIEAAPIGIYEDRVGKCARLINGLKWLAKEATFLTSHEVHKLNGEVRELQSKINLFIQNTGIGNVSIETLIQESENRMMNKIHDINTIIRNEIRALATSSTFPNSNTTSTSSMLVENTGNILEVDYSNVFSTMNVDTQDQNDLSYRKISKWYTWGGRLHIVPEQFKFPTGKSVSIISLWRLWFDGNRNYSIESSGDVVIPPYRLLKDTKDFGKYSHLYSKASTCMKAFSDVAIREGFVMSQKDIEKSNIAQLEIIFQKVKDVLDGEIGNLTLNRKGNDTPYTTYFSNLPPEYKNKYTKKKHCF